MAGTVATTLPRAILTGEWFVKVGDNYNFVLTINNSDPLATIESVTFQIGERSWHWTMTSNVRPLVLRSWIPLPAGEWGSWYPRFIITGRDAWNYPQELSLDFRRRITATNTTPIFNTPLSCSIWDSDRWKIDPIRNFLSIWGLSCYTMGMEVEARTPAGRGFLGEVKEWADNGDCFVAVLTERDLSQLSGEGLPTAWNQAEAGMSFTKDKPQLAFVEKGVRTEAIFKHLDADHVIEFDPTNISSTLNVARVQINRFREECAEYRRNTTITQIAKVVGIGLAAVGAVAVLGKVLK